MKNQSVHWNETAAHYATNLEKATLPSGINLSRMARVGKAKSILEVGCGAGLLTLHWLKTLPAGTKYTSVDLSEQMIKICQQRKEEQKYQLNDIQHEFAIGDIQDLKMIPDESVDVYIAPLSYCHVSDPIKAFSEAKRVLKSGGRIGVSMSMLQNNTLQIFWRNCVAKLHQGEQGHGHGNNHHHERAIKGKDHLIQLAQEAGFEVDYCWEHGTIFDILDENDAVELTKNPGMSNMYQNLSEEQKPKFVEILKSEFAEFKKAQTPLGFNALFLTAKKPASVEFGTSQL